MADSQSIAGYEVVRVAGSGAHSTIYCVRDRSGKRFALKVVQREMASDQRFLDQAIAEHEVASQFDHPLLRKSYRLLRERKLIRTSTVRVLMEYVEGKPLEQFRTAAVALQADLCRQVGEGLAAMHAKGYVHADMKPNNVMVTREGLVKIIDFGQSCPVHTRKTRVQGTPDYIAPEQVRKESLTPQTDIFNLGATMYWLLTGEHVPTLIPKQKRSAGELKSDRKIEPPAALNPSVAPALSSVVMDCIVPEPEQRPRTMREVVDRIRIAQSQLDRVRAGAKESLDGSDGEGGDRADRETMDRPSKDAERTAQQGTERSTDRSTGKSAGVNGSATGRSEEEGWDERLGTWVNGAFRPQPEAG